MRVHLPGRAATRGSRLGNVKKYMRTQFGLMNNGASTLKWSVPLIPQFAGPGSRGGDGNVSTAAEFESLEQRSRTRVTTSASLLRMAMEWWGIMPLYASRPRHSSRVDEQARRLLRKRVADLDYWRMVRPVRAVHRVTEKSLIFPTSGNPCLQNPDGRKSHELRTRSLHLPGNSRLLLLGPLPGSRHI